MAVWAMALVIAFSPFALIPAVLLLLAENPRRLALAFLAGWSGGVVVLVTVAVALADVVEACQAPDWFGWIRGVLGVLLIGLGARGLISHGASEGPGWANRLVGMNPSKAMSLGLVLALANPKVIALAAAGGLTIGSSTTSFRAEVVQAAIFVAVASLGIALPLGVHILIGDRAQTWLGTIEAWLDRRGDQLMGVVMALIGAYLLIDVLL